MLRVIDLTFQDGIATLRLANGPVNALDGELLATLCDALDEAEEAQASAVVLTGSGPAFSAGADLIRLMNEGSGYVERARPHASRAFERLFCYPLPTVAAVNGHAIAGGCVLALACDHRISAAGEHRIGLPELKVGVPFPAWALETVRFSVPPPIAQRLLYSGTLARPDEARELGLIDEVVPADRLLEASIGAAKKLASIPAATFALTKHSLRAPFAERARAGGSIDDQGAAIWSASETLESVRRFVDRTFRSS